MNNKDQDAIYIKKVLRGDTDAYRFFIKKYQETLYDLAKPIVKDSHAADEVVHKTFINAYKALKSFKHEAMFLTWLGRIVINESLAYIRRNKTYISRIQQLSSTKDQVSISNDILLDLELEEKRAEIKRTLLAMKPKESLVLNLFYLKEYSIAEIKEITGFSTANIKVLLHRARKSFSLLFNMQP